MRQRLSRAHLWCSYVSKLDTLFLSVGMGSTFMNKKKSLYLKPLCLWRYIDIIFSLNKNMCQFNFESNLYTSPEFAFQLCINTSNSFNKLGRCLRNVVLNKKYTDILLLKAICVDCDRHIYTSPEFAFQFCINTSNSFCGKDV